MEQLRIWFEQLVSSLGAAAQNLIEYTPGILLAAAVIVLGWLVAMVLRRLTLKGIEQLDWIFGHATVKSAEDAAALRHGIARAISTIVFWAVLLTFFTAALASLDWPLLDAWTDDLVAYIPSFIGGAAIVVLGFVAGTLIRHIVEPTAASLNIANSAIIGRLTQIAIIVTAVVIGTSQIGIDVTFIVQLATVVVGTTLAGFALALALGMREQLANLIGARYARKRYRIGDRLRVGDVDGRIIEISDGCLFLETPEGDVSIPGKDFTTRQFVKLNDEVPNG